MAEREEGKPSDGIDDIIVGVEMGLLTQEQVVAEFRRAVERDVGEAATRYEEFVAKLEQAASGGDAFIRSAMGGPDSSCRADLIDIMAGKYATASVEVKEMIRDAALVPLLRDNCFYVQLALAKMRNPYLIGDIIRKFPEVNPGARYYEESLLKQGCLDDADELQAWLDVVDSIFAAATVALRREEDEALFKEMMVEHVIRRNQPLFWSAAHVIAARHDWTAETRRHQGDTTPKEQLMARYRAKFIDMFAEMIRQESETANWIPLEHVE